MTLFGGMCTMLTINSLLYIVWTHRVFGAGDAKAAREIAREQEQRGPSRFAKWFGFARVEDWAMTAALSALVVAIVAAVIGASVMEPWLLALVLVTAGTAWTTMVYAFALRYLRLDAGGQRIDFDIDEEPEFSDFVSFSVMISSVGALSPGTPRTRAGLKAVRTHTYLAFAFNTLVVAMIVALVTGNFSAE